MTSAEVILSIFFAIFFSLACGLAYAFAAGDSKPRKRKTVFVALLSGFIGWTFAMVIPIQEYKFVGAMVVALIASIYGSHIYWFIFKQKSKTTKTIDANCSTRKMQKSAFNSI